MKIDLGLVVQEAFTVLREDAQEVSNISLKIKGQKIKVEEMVKLLIQHLVEIDLIDVNMDRLAQKTANLDNLVTPTNMTLALPANRVERLALELETLTPDEITRLIVFMNQSTRQQLAEQIALRHKKEGD